MIRPVHRVFISTEAAFEMDAAFLWYEAQRSGLGHEFLQSVDAAVSAIGKDPAIFRSVRPGVRRAVLRRFPYGVFFAIGDDRVIVLAVVHHRWSPTRWPQPPAG